MVRKNTTENVNKLKNLNLSLYVIYKNDIALVVTDMPHSKLYIICHDSGLNRHKNVAPVSVFAVSSHPQW